MNTATRIALANARAAEAQITAYAANSVDLAYLRNIARKLSQAMEALEQALTLTEPASRQPLEGMLYLDELESTDAAPALSFTEFSERRASA
jgi:hypothetical protein